MAKKDEQTVVASRSDGIVAQITAKANGVSEVTVDLGCCKMVRLIPDRLAQPPELDRIVLEMEQELIATYGPRWSPMDPKR